jgi:hypothetical protein
MGASGPGLFSDDLAADVRDMYMELLREGVPDTDATDRLIAAWRESIEETDEADVFWFALAATQAKVGRLEDRVRDKAIEALNDGTDLAEWRRSNPKLAGRRAHVLDDLRATLVGPQRPRTVVKPKRAPAQAPFAEGDLLRYALPEGRSLLLRVVRAFDAKNMVYDVLLWIGTDLPDEAGVRAILERMPSISAVTAARDERRFWSLGGLKLVRDHVSVVGRVAWDDPEQGWWNTTFSTWRGLPQSVWRDIEAYQGGPEPPASLEPAAPWRTGVTGEGRLALWEDRTEA